MELGHKTECVGEVKTEHRALTGRGASVATGGGIVPDVAETLYILAGRIKSALAAWGGKK